MAEVVLNVKLDDKTARAELDSFIAKAKEIESRGLKLGFDPSVIKNFDAIVNSAQKFLSTSLAKEFQDVDGAIRNVSSGLTSTSNSLQRYRSIVEMLSAAVNAGVISEQQYNESINETFKKAEDAVTKIGQLSLTLEELRSRQDRLVTSMKESSSEYREFTSEVEKATAATLQFNASRQFAEMFGSRNRINFGSPLENTTNLFAAETAAYNAERSLPVSPVYARLFDEAEQKFWEVRGRQRLEADRLSSLRGYVESYNKDVKSSAETSKEMAMAEANAVILQLKRNRVTEDYIKKAEEYNKKQSEALRLEQASKVQARQAVQEEYIKEQNELNRQIREVEEGLERYNKELSAAKFSAFAGIFSGLQNVVENASRIITSALSLPGVSTISSVVSNLASMPLSGFTGAISSGFGTAVERYDILKSFPRVMEAIGFESSLAKEATDRLRDSILGLPIALNEVTETAQYFTLLTGDLEKATDLTIALNNSFIASGASQEQITTGTRVLTYLLEGATLTTRQWFSLIRSMPVGLKYVGEALGYPDLKGFTKELREGNIELDTFVDTLIDVGLNSPQLSSILDVFKNKLSAAITNLGIAAQRMGESLLTALNGSLGGESFGITGAVKSFAAILDNIGKVGASWIIDHSAEINDIVFRILNYDWEGFIEGALQGILDSLERGLNFIDLISKNGSEMFGSLITGGQTFAEELRVIASLLGGVSSIIKTIASVSIYRNFMGGFRGAEDYLSKIIKSNPLGATAKGLSGVPVAVSTGASGQRVLQMFDQKTGKSFIVPDNGGGGGFLSAINSIAPWVAGITAIVGTIELISEAVDLSNTGVDQANKIVGSISTSLNSMPPLNLENFEDNRQELSGLIETLKSNLSQNNAILNDVKSGGGWSTLLGRGVSSEELSSYREGNAILNDQIADIEKKIAEYDKISSDPRYKYISGLSGISFDFMGVETSKILTALQDSIFNSIRDENEINELVLSAATTIIENADGWVDAYTEANNRVTSAQNEVSRLEEELSKVKEKTQETYSKISKYQSIWGKGNKYLSQQLEEDPEASFLYRNTRRDALELGTKGASLGRQLKGRLVNAFRNGKLTASQANIYGQFLDELMTDPAANYKRLEKLFGEITSADGYGWENWDDSFLVQEEQYNAQIAGYQQQQISWELETAQNELSSAEESLATTVDQLTNAFLETVRPIIEGFVPNLWEMMFGEVDDSDIEGGAEDAGEEIGNQISDGLTAGIASMDISSAINAARDKLNTVVESIQRMFNRSYTFSTPSFNLNKGDLTYIPGYGYVTDAAGGSIPSFGTDTVPAMLTPGEYVHRRAVVQHYGKAFMDRLNNLDLQGALATLSMGYVVPFATGGLVRSDNRTYRDNHASIVQNFNNSRSDYSFRRANRFVRGLA